MPTSRRGGRSVRSGSAPSARGSRHRPCAKGWLAFALCALGFMACTPIEPVQNAADAADAGGATATTRRTNGCQHDTDCPRSSACTRSRCTNGTCSEQPEPDGVPLPPELQVVGDCRSSLCDGAGRIRMVDDETDKLPGDGNPCHTVECRGGSASVVNMPDTTACNATGVCRSGVCSVCSEGMDCSRPGDCTVHRTSCDRSDAPCLNTDEPRQAGACQTGKVCEGGRCVPCTVGAECEVDIACYIGIITSCEGGRQCEPRPVSGPECGMNSAGQRRYCVEGACTLPCREGPCMSTEPCHTSRWDCSNGNAAPSCIELPQPDGSACGEAASCHAGQCSHNALVNGSFTQGLAGWTASGDANSFMLAPSAGRVERSVLSTSADGKSSGGSLRGTLSQQFMVPSDALALRFIIWGGHAHVLLKGAGGNVLEDCAGLDSDSRQIPVSWDLSARRGQQLTLSIEDELNSGDWAYVSVSGFDVIRDVDAPLRNSQFAQAWTGWETTVDATHFNTFLDHGAYARADPSSGLPAYGRRLSVSTYGRDSDAPYGDLTTGTLAQQFVVPNDAVALRFFVHGGRAARVALLAGKEVLRSVSADNADDPKLIVEWPLISEREKTLRLVIEDNSTATPYGYIGTTGFDLITSYNGP